MATIVIIIIGRAAADGGASEPRRRPRRRRFGGRDGADSRHMHAQRGVLQQPSGSRGRSQIWELPIIVMTSRISRDRMNGAARNSPPYMYYEYE
jgi:hypothetical protein